MLIDNHDDKCMLELILNIPAEVIVKIVLQTRIESQSAYMTIFDIVNETESHGSSVSFFHGSIGN